MTLAYYSKSDSGDSSNINNDDIVMIYVQVFLPLSSNYEVCILYVYSISVSPLLACTQNLYQHQLGHMNWRLPIRCCVRFLANPIDRSSLLQVTWYITSNVTLVDSCLFPISYYRKQQRIKTPTFLECEKIKYIYPFHIVQSSVDNNHAIMTRFDILSCNR